MLKPDSRSTDKHNAYNGFGGTVSSTDSNRIETQTTEPDLQAVIDVWPTLPTAIKVGIMAMVHTADGGVES